MGGPSMAEPADLASLSHEDYVWDRGGFRQRDLTVRVTYDAAYLESRYAAVDANVRALSAARLRVLEAFVPHGLLLDFGCGTGRFVQAAAAPAHGWDVLGYDLVPPWTELPDLTWHAVTFFDSLEHLVDPAGTIQRLDPRWLMISVPWCHHPNDRAWFMRWKHRRPGEHLWHWGRQDLDAFLEPLGYRPVMHSSFEDAWRPNPAQPDSNILTAVYRRRT